LNQSLMADIALIGPNLRHFEHPGATGIFRPGPSPRISGSVAAAQAASAACSRADPADKHKRERQRESRILERPYHAHQGRADRKLGSHWTRRWREVDSNSRSRARARSLPRWRQSMSGGVCGTGSGAAADRAFSCSAAHSIEPGAHTIFTSGLRRCFCACRRIVLSPIGW